jgi:hypothetical protein
MDITQSTVATSIVGGAAAPGTGRGVVVQLGKATGVALNTVAATSIFTTPAVGGFTRCVVTQVVWDNASAIATTTSVSYGASGTPTDWAATATLAGLTTTGKQIQVIGGPPATGSATYGAGVSFVANITIPQGVATSADVTAYGYYE